jgi:hypothetical protein
MIALPNIPENEILETIEDVAIRLANKFNGFAYFDCDDIKQEVRIVCLEALNKFNPAKGTLGVFLFAHSYNRITNKRRDTTERTLHVHHVEELMKRAAELDVPKLVLVRATRRGATGTDERSCCRNGSNTRMTSHVSPTRTTSSTWRQPKY